MWGRFLVEESARRREGRAAPALAMCAGSGPGGMDVARAPSVWPTPGKSPPLLFPVFPSGSDLLLTIRP